MKTTYLKGILAASIFAIAHMAQAAPANMVTLGKTNPPIGHYEFCKTNPGMCGSMSDNGPLQLTEAKWKTLLKVNYTANTTIEPMTDQEIYGVEERWVLPTTVGDCEDYVLLKQKMLVQRGFSPSDLLIAVVLQPNGDGHAVLVVRTDRGDFVLDNRRAEILGWDHTEYRWYKITAPDDPRRWVTVSGSRFV